MESLKVDSTEARLHPRIPIAQGTVQARMPIPNNWNWFTNVNSVDVINISRSGVGIACRVPLDDYIEFFFKLESGEHYVFKGLIKHQRETVDGIYHGVQLCNGQDCIMSLFKQCCPNSLKADLTVIAH